jgi:uncharacterized tellurite resistance protein B-like protein
MLNRIRKFMAGGSPAAREDPADEMQLAAAALLVEVATVDENFDADERARILAFVTDRFGLSGDDATALIEAAEREVDGSVQLFAFTSAISSGFSYDEKVELMETLWRVVLADGHVDAHEDQLLRRIAGLIHVTDRDRGLARKRAKEEL